MTRRFSLPELGRSSSKPGEEIAEGRAAAFTCPGRRRDMDASHRSWFAGASIGKVALGISPSNSKIVYAMIETDDGVIWRSEDGEKTGISSAVITCSTSGPTTIRGSPWRRTIPTSFTLKAYDR